jgi:hypothetical protein
MSAVAVRLFAERNVGAADELRRLAGWNQTLRTGAVCCRWNRRMLRRCPDGKVIGTVTTTTYGAALAWIE